MSVFRTPTQVLSSFRTCVVVFTRIRLSPIAIDRIHSVVWLALSTLPAVFRLATVLPAVGAVPIESVTSSWGQVDLVLQVSFAASVAFACAFAPAFAFSFALVVSTVSALASCAAFPFAFFPFPSPGRRLPRVLVLRSCSRRSQPRTA